MMRSAHSIPLVAGALLASLTAGAWAQDDAATEALGQRVAALLETGDSGLALEEIEAVGHPAEVAQAYFKTALWLYNEAKAPDLMILVSRAGMHYCLLRAQDVELEDSDLAYSLRATAKAMAFNLAANAWPAWEDEGIELTEASIAAGYDAAKINLRLAESLGKGPGPEAAAHWLLGAYELIREDWEAARAHFEASVGAADMAHESAAGLMASGYARMVDILAADEGAEDRAPFDEVLAELAALESEDATFYHDQLVHVLEFMTR